MKFDLTHALAGLAVLLLGIHMGRRQAKASDQAQGTVSETPANWWTYSDGWN